MELDIIDEYPELDDKGAASHFLKNQCFSAKVGTTAGELGEESLADRDSSRSELLCYEAGNSYWHEGLRDVDKGIIADGGHGDEFFIPEEAMCKRIDSEARDLELCQGSSGGCDETGGISPMVESLVGDADDAGGVLPQWCHGLFGSIIVLKTWWLLAYGGHGDAEEVLDDAAISVTSKVGGKGENFFHRDEVWCVAMIPM